jgi:hypothetical protein
MTTIFFAIIGIIALLFVMLVSILHVSHKPEPKQFPHLNPEDLMDDECDHEWKPVTKGFAECIHCHEEKEW